MAFSTMWMQQTGRWWGLSPEALRLGDKNGLLSATYVTMGTGLIGGAHLAALFSRENLSSTPDRRLSNSIIMSGKAFASLGLAAFVYSIFARCVQPGFSSRVLERAQVGALLIPLFHSMILSPLLLAGLIALKLKVGGQTKQEAITECLQLPKAIRLMAITGICHTSLRILAGTVKEGVESWLEWQIKHCDTTAVQTAISYYGLRAINEGTLWLALAALPLHLLSKELRNTAPCSIIDPMGFNQRITLTREKLDNWAKKAIVVQKICLGLAAAGCAFSLLVISKRLKAC